MDASSQLHHLRRVSAHDEPPDVSNVSASAALEMRKVLRRLPPSPTRSASGNSSLCNKSCCLYVALMTATTMVEATAMNTST